MYGMAYLFQPSPNIPVATDYIEKAKLLIYQNYGLIDVQLLQALFLITIFGNFKLIIFYIIILLYDRL